MTSRVGRAAAVIAAVSVLTMLTACTDEAGIGLHNESDEAVTVDYGGESPEEFEPTSGMVLIEADGCLDGPLVVTYEDGRSVDVPGPLCPGEDLRITAQDAEIAAAQ